MKDKKIFIILALTFVVILGGSKLILEMFGSDYSGEQLVVEEGAGTVQEQENQSSNTTVDENEATDTDATSDSNNASEVEKSLAPDFTVYDIKGNAVSLSDYIGKPTVVNFWASWCGPCMREMPDFQKLYDELGSEVNFLMVNMTDGSRETVNRASGFIKGEGYTFPVFYDTDQDAAMTYAVYSIPTTYFVDAEGKGIAYASGAIDEATLRKGISMIR